MNIKHWILLGLVVLATLIIGQASTAPGALNIAQAPLFARASLPPLNMLVMGKDHKIYYEAYNDASDLDGDGGLEVGYQGWATKVVNGATVFKIDYFGYFNSYACYSWDGSKFNPVGAAPNKTCTGQWSGDFLNYLTTSRMDALRRVLYGGWRQVDSATETVLQGAFFPQDAHSWGKEYRSVARDGYDIANYAPLTQPTGQNYHLFAVTTVTDNSAPLFRVLKNAPYRVWNWLSIEGPVAGNKCFTSGNVRVNCVSGPAAHPGHPASRAAFDTFETTWAQPAYSYGASALTTINCNSTACNPNNASQDNYLAVITGVIRPATTGFYQFRTDGDEAFDFQLRTAGGVVLAQAGCYGSGGFRTCSNGEKTASIQLTANTDYAVKFRQEDAAGGDGYRLTFKPCNNANSSCSGPGSFSPVLTGSGDVRFTSASIATYNIAPTIGGSTRDDYAVRVSVCPDTEALRDNTCKAYPNGNFKPTGILHDYGESERMYFGLITGSQQNNLEGGKLRRNVGNFKDELEANTGRFRTDVNGIARSIDRLRMIGGAYNSGTNNLNADSNWNWGNSNGNCAGTGDEITNGNCRMWGNPIAEMMYESLRYFAGAGVATTRFSAGGSANGVAEETAMGMTDGAWSDPYKSTAEGGLGFPVCARPYQTVISDINPSYDGNLPNNAFGAVATTNDTPASISAFHAADEGAAIWNHEFGGPRSVFIGEVGGVTDGAPTAKTASSFGNIRGLSPEEPTKGGTYYAASVARFGRVNDINAAPNAQKLSTYSIALASPLPRIEFPVGGRTVTLMPFAKTVSGTFGGGARKPTNTIVDFYVEQIVNLPGQASNAAVNGGRPYAVFRINYEDVEQGNDHDMDAIVRYEVMTNADSTLSVNLTSEYAAGSANQNMGYVISGTTRDGVYLEVRDTDSPANQSLYILNTPPGAWAGDCIAGNNTAPCNQYLGFTAQRTFSPAASGAVSATQLKDPLWYAAKYGGFNESAGGNGLPDTSEWDADNNGVPDNYFLVTNPLNLRSQLTKAFDSIQQQNGNSGTISLAGARVDTGSFAVLPSYNSLAGGKDWIGDLTAYRITSTGALGASVWSASTQLALTPVPDRKIFTATSNVNSANRGTAVVEFAADNLGANPSEMFGSLGYTLAQVINVFGGTTTPAQMVEYLRGGRDREGGVKNTAQFRKRTSIMGDIINSAPVIATKRANYGWAYATGLPVAQRTSYTTYVASKSTRVEHSFVGANDGMLHAFDNVGDEAFAYIPNGVLNKMGLLADPDYTHQYYVDGNLTLADVRIGSSWQTVLAGATGAGGRSVFALNVSDAGSFGAADVLWEVNSTTDADMGYVMGKPLIVPTDSGRWVAIFGNGYNSQSYDPVLFVVDVATGEVIKKIAPVDGTTESNGLGSVSAIDTDNDGLVDTVYGGDLQGNVWKFDIGGAMPADWGVALGGTPLFVAVDAGGTPQPITGAFEVAVGPGTGYMLYFGTGRYFVSGDNNASLGQQVQSLYGIWDNGTALTSGRSTLVGQQITGTGGATPELRSVSRNAVSYLSNRGWYLDLKVGTNDTGERFIATPRLQSGKIFFPTYQPGFASDCAPGGSNWLYALDPLSGAAALGKITQPDVGDGNTGGVSTGDGAPSRGVGVTQPQPPASLFCDPADPACATYCDPADPSCGVLPPPDTQCSEVIIDPTNPGTPLVIQRACGRQSWRQLL